MKIVLLAVAAAMVAGCGVTHVVTSSKPTAVTDDSFIRPARDRTADLSPSAPGSPSTGTGSASSAGSSTRSGGASNAGDAGGDAPDFPSCHEDSTQVKQTSDKGGPAKLGPDTSGQGKQAYYYLTLTAGCGQPVGTPVTLTVRLVWTALLSGRADADGQCWRLDFNLGYDHTPLQGSVTELMFGGLGSGVTLTSTAFKAGDHVRLRIANLENDVIQDHASIDG